MLSDFYTSAIHKQSRNRERAGAGHGVLGICISDRSSERKDRREHWPVFQSFWTRTHHDPGVLVLVSQTGGLRMIDESVGKEEPGSFYMSAKVSGVIGGME